MANLEEHLIRPYCCPRCSVHDWVSQRDLTPSDSHDLLESLERLADLIDGFDLRDDVVHVLSKLEASEIVGLLLTLRTGRGA